VKRCASAFVLPYAFIRQAAARWWRLCRVALNGAACVRCPASDVASRQETCACHAARVQARHKVPRAADYAVRRYFLSRQAGSALQVRFSAAASIVRPARCASACREVLKQHVRVLRIETYRRTTGADRRESRSTLYSEYSSRLRALKKENTDVHRAAKHFQSSVRQRVRSASPAACKCSRFCRCRGARHAQPSQDIGGGRCPGAT